MEPLFLLILHFADDDAVRCDLQNLQKPITHFFKACIQMEKELALAHTLTETAAWRDQVMTQGLVAGARRKEGRTREDHEVLVTGGGRLQRLH